MKLKIANWTKTYKKATDVKDWKRKLVEAESLVDARQLQQYEESKSAMLAKELLKEFGKGNYKEVSRSEYCAIRDHLIACIHFGNGHRSGVSAYMTRYEVRVAKKNTMNEMEILVQKHKRSQDGPAPIILPNYQYHWLSIFEQKVRSQIRTDVPNVFISWEGKPLRSGAVSVQLDSLFLKAGVYGDKPCPDRKRLCANHIRRSISTAIRDREMGISEKQKVADLMCHAVETADKHYYIRKKLATAPEAASIVRSVFYGDKNGSSSTGLSATLDSDPEQNLSPRREEYVSDVCVTPVRSMSDLEDTDPSYVNTPRLMKIK